MNTQKPRDPSHADLTWEDLNILLDALHILIRTLEEDPTHEEAERQYAIIKAAHVLGKLFPLYEWSTQVGYQPILWYQVRPLGITVTRLRRN